MILAFIQVVLGYQVEYKMTLQGTEYWLTEKFLKNESPRCLTVVLRGPETPAQGVARGAQLLLLTV